MFVVCFGLSQKGARLHQCTHSHQYIGIHDYRVCLLYWTAEVVNKLSWLPNMQVTLLPKLIKSGNLWWKMLRIT